MTRSLMSILVALCSLVWFPWPLTVMLTLLATLFTPLIAPAIGLLADVLYYAPETHSVPVYALLGTVAACVAVYLRARVKTSIMNA